MPMVPGASRRELSSIGQVLARALQLEAVLDSVCRACVAAGFGRTWIGRQNKERFEVVVCSTSVEEIPARERALGEAVMASGHRESAASATAVPFQACEREGSRAVLVLAAASGISTRDIDDVVARAQEVPVSPDGARVAAGEHTYRMLVENITDVVWMMDFASQRFVYISPSVLGMRGFTEEEAMAQPASAKLGGDGMTRLLPLFLRRADAFRRGAREAYIDVVALPHKNGSLIWTEQTSRFALDPETRRLVLYGASRDITDRRLAEHALQERFRVNEQLANIGASLPGAVISFELSADGSARIPYSTLQAVELTGLTRDELARDFASFTDRLDPKDRLALMESISESAQSLTPWHQEIRYPHPHRGERFLEGWSMPVRREAGVTVWHGFVTDVTDRKTAEQRALRVSGLYQALADTREALARAADEQALFERLAEILVRIDSCTCAWIATYDEARRGLVRRAKAGTLDDASGGFVGLSERNLITRVFREGRSFAVQDYKAALRGAPDPVGMDPSVASVVALPLRRDGAVVGVLGLAATRRGCFDPDLVRHLENITQDISFGLDARAATVALRVSDERYRAVLENLEDVVFTLDEGGSFLLVSGSISRLGFSSAQFLGTQLVARVHPSDVARAEHALAEVRSGRPAVEEIRVVDAGGKTRFLRLSMRPALRGDVVSGAHGVLTDLTRQHETEEQLRLAQKMEAVGRLAGGVAHDFNNLLSVIGAYVDVALDSLGATDPLHADLLEARKAAKRAESLTRQLLAFSRKQVLQPLRIDLNSLVGGLTRMLERLIGEDIDLQFVPGAGLYAIEADPGQLEQVLMNLCVNSRDAMPDGGTLTIETSNVELAGPTEVASTHGESAAQPGAYVLLSVSDTGTGMDDATLARVFEPFFTTKGVGKGTGLGLATVYGIVRQSGGLIQVDSRVGAGTRFQIYLPRVARVEAPRAATEAPAPRGAIIGQRVLVVEDEEMVRKLVCRILKTAGYEVTAAANPGEAILITERPSEVIDLLLTDVVMPRMSGKELADRVRTGRPGIRVLYMSGYTDEAIDHHGVLEPGVHLISKPFTGDRLLAEVRSALERS
jgi:PAS domain S-box-containing protein